MGVDWRRLIATWSIAKHMIVVVFGLCGFASQAVAEPVRVAQQARPQAPQQAQPPQQAPTPVVMPTAKQIVLLTRSALLTLSDAMRTGNYTVLHDVGAPSFRKADPPARLAQIFSTLVARRVDLALVAITVPRMNEARLDEKARLLRLTGTFPTQPTQINFVLLFQEVSGVWRLFGISVDASPVAAAPANVPAGAGGGSPPPQRKRSPVPDQASVAAPGNAASGAAPGSQPPLPKRNPGARGWTTGVAPANAAAGAGPVNQRAPSTRNPDAVRQSSGRASSAPRTRDSEDWGQ